MSRLEKAIFIADTLFGKHLSGDPSVGVNNWKVEAFMYQFNDAAMNDAYEIAQQARRGTANLACFPAISD